MANTFDTSRVGGGTYELEQDANGNYKLKSVGFTQVNKLNLPDLATSDTTAATTTPKTEDKKIEVADPFLKLGTQNTGGGEGGGQDYSGVMLKSPEVKDVSVRDAGESMTKIDTGKTDGKFLASGAAGGASLKGDKASGGFLASGAAGGASLSSKVEEQKPGMLSTPQQQQETFAARTTGLQKVTSAISNTVENIMNNSATVAVVKGISNAITNPEQQINNAANSTALKSNGYITNQQGKVIGKDGQAVSAADSVFGGMNSVSGFGDISAGAASRIGTRNTIGQARVDAKYGKDSKKSKDFAAKTKEFEKELQSHNNKKNSEKEAAKTKDTKSTNPNKRAGASDGGSGSSRVICTYFYSKNQFSLIDLQLDTEFSRNNLSDEVKIGYWFWAIPLVDWMKKHENSNNWWVKLVKNSTKLFAQERAKEIAYTMGKKNKGSLIGKFVRLFGETGCYILGLIIKPFVFNKYKGFLNEYQKDVNLIGKI